MTGFAFCVTAATPEYQGEAPNCSHGPAMLSAAPWKTVARVSSAPATGRPPFVTTPHTALVPAVGVKFAVNISFGIPQQSMRVDLTTNTPSSFPPSVGPTDLLGSSIAWCNPPDATTPSLVLGAPGVDIGGTDAGGVWAVWLTANKTMSTFVRWVSGSGQIGRAHV